jgi:hypothetical protein
MPSKQGGRSRDRKQAEEEPAPSRKGTIAIAVAIIVTIMVIALLLQSGIFNLTGASGDDVRAATQTFNSFAAALNSHNAKVAFDLTTMKFVSKNVSNTVLIDFFMSIFSDQNLSFSASGIQYFSEEQMTSAQRSYSLGVIENITDPNSVLHIDQVVTGYVLVNGNMAMSGIENPPQIDDMVIANIGTGWFIVLR